MNMLARPGKPPLHAATVSTPEPPGAPRQSHEQIRPAPVREQVGPSIIGPGMSVVGRLDCSGHIQIEGNVEGEIRGKGVTIGSGAVINGTVVGETVQLAGTIEGNIEAELVVLAKTARVSGDICSQTLQIEQGAFFSGNSRPGRKQTTPQRPIELTKREVPLWLQGEGALKGVVE